jgi:sulfonate transport system substrate-binding protein
MAASELDAGSTLLYRNIDFNTYGFLNAREAFLGAYPALTETVLTAYERARRWILDNQEEAAGILAAEASLSTEVPPECWPSGRPSTSARCRGRTSAPRWRRSSDLRGGEPGPAGTDLPAVLDSLLAPRSSRRSSRPTGGDAGGVTVSR